MFNKIRETRFITKEIKIPLEKIISELAAFRNISDIIMICPKPTGNSWRGIYNGAIAFFPNGVFELPHYYGNTVYSIDELKKISETIVYLKFSKIIFSGYLPFFKNLITYIHKAKGSQIHTELFIIYHGFLSEIAETPSYNELLQEIFTLNKNGQVKKIGFIKQGLAETFTQIHSINACHLIPKTVSVENIKTTSIFNSTELNIGVFCNNSFRKNIHNQVAAAIMFPQSEVHVHGNYNFDYLGNNHRLKIHSFIEDYNSFLQIIGSMTLNLYTTYSESFGLIITESLALGVPCLASNNSGLLDYDQWLKDLLIVKENDSPESIYKQAEIVLNNHAEISVRGKEYVKILNIKSDELMHNFLFE